MLAKSEFMSRLESFRLNQLIERSAKINEYDYNNMVKDFRLIDKQHVIKAKRIHNIKSHNKKWKGEVAKIKNETQHHLIEVQKSLNNKYKIKEQKIKDLRKQIHDQIIANHSLSLKTDPNSRKNTNYNSVEYTKELDEQDRLYTQSCVEERIERLSNKRQEHLNEIKQKMLFRNNQVTNKLLERIHSTESQHINKSQQINQSNSLPPINQSLTKVDNSNFNNVMFTNESNKNITINNKSNNESKSLGDKVMDNDFLKFEKQYYSNLRKKAKSRSKQYNNNQKFENVRYNLEEMNKQEQKKINKYYNQYNKERVKTASVRDGNSVILNEVLSKRNFLTEIPNKEELNHKHLRDLERIYDDKCYNLIYKQTESFKRVQEKQINNNVSNLLTVENTIISQLTKEKQVNEIENQLNKLKQSSVLGKSKEQRQEIFDEIKRLEREEKQRKLEEMLKKING